MVMRTLGSVLVGVDKYCFGCYLLVSETQLNKQQLAIAKDHCDKLLIQLHPR